MTTIEMDLIQNMIIISVGRSPIYFKLTFLVEGEGRTAKVSLDTTLKSSFTFYPGDVRLQNMIGKVSLKNAMKEELDSLS